MPYGITYMWNLKYHTNEPIYETEGGKGGGMNWKIGIDVYTLLILV